jgi:hypothetical protein
MIFFIVSKTDLGNISGFCVTIFQDFRLENKRTTTK